MKHLLLSSLQLGQLLKSARKRMGLSQQDLGERVGLSQARISHMEREPQSISMDQLLSLLSVLKLELVVQDQITSELTVVPDPVRAVKPADSRPEVEW